MLAIPILLSLLRRVKDRGTHVIWISTTDFSKNDIIKDLNNMAKRYCTIYGLSYIHVYMRVYVYIY